MHEDRKFQAVIFDMDGVIVDSEIVYHKWLVEYLTEHGYEVPEEKLYALVGINSEQNVAFFEQLLGPGVGAKVWADYVDECNRRTIDYREILIPGVTELLQWLYQSHIPTGLASASSYQDIHQVLSDTGLTDYFSQIMSGENLEKNKPDPEVYRRTAALLEVKPEECVIIEDSDYGIAAGKAAGGYVIARKEDRFGFIQDQEDVLANDMWEIAEKVKELFKDSFENS